MKQKIIRNYIKTYVNLFFTRCLDVLSINEIENLLRHDFSVFKLQLNREVVLRHRIRPKLLRECDEYYLVIWQLTTCVKKFYYRCMFRNMS